MNFQPNPLQVLVLWKMLFLGEYYSYSKSKPKLQPKARQELVQAGLAEVVKKGNSSFLVLTDKAWYWASENLDARVSDKSPQAGPILQGVLIKLQNFIRESNISLAEFIQSPSNQPLSSTAKEVPSPETKPDTVNTQAEIRNAYLQAADGKFHTQVRLARLRERLASIPRPVVDEVLQRMYWEEQIFLYSLDDPQAIHPEDEQAAIRISERDRHIIIVKG